MQNSSKSSSPDNIDLKDTWITPDLEEDARETTTHIPRVSSENNKNMITSSQSVQQVQEISVSEGASVSEVIEHPVS